jgi:CPA2 family monovalent cation:H+ antiporter-2
LFLLNNSGTLIALVAAVMLGKAVIIAPVVALFGYPLKTALTVGLGINQIGEFSFVLSGVASKLGLFSPKLYGLTVGTTAITLLLTPFLLKLTPYLFQRLESVPGLGRWLRAGQYPKASFIPEHLTNHCIVAGYGRVGETLVRLLRSRGYQILVIENDEATLQILRERKIPYVYGDASSELVLKKAKLTHAQSLAIALPDPIATRLALKRAVSLVPELDITVRAHANQEIDVLYQLGAKEVVQPEFEAALEMGAHVLLNLGGEVSGILQSIESYRADRYRDILPDRFDYLASMNFGEAIQGLDGNWHVLKQGSALVGQTLAQANIRQLTGATVMAIRRGRQLLRYPDPQTVVMVGDRLLVVGDAQEQNAFERLLG